MQRTLSALESGTGVKLPRKRGREHVHLPDQKVAAVIDANGDHAAEVAALAYAGLR
jgi:hypothetical protein